MINGAAVETRASVIGIHRLRDFVGAIGALVDATHDETIILERGRVLLAGLVAHDDWLPGAYAEPDPARYRQYLLHCDSRERFSVVSFVWGPGQGTPIHDHRVWGLVGVLRGREIDERFVKDARGRLVTDGAPAVLQPGSVVAVSPRIGDLHRVSNGHPDRISISIHVYGGNIGAVERATYDVIGTEKRFVSGYANGLLPNLWDRSRSS